VAERIKAETGVRTEFVVADLASVADCRRVIAEADKAFGRVDILVNAAGLTDRGNLLNSSEELFDRMFAVNVRAPFFLMQEAAKLMIRDKIAGSIVNIGSTSSRAGQPFISPYSASKGALATLTRNSGYALMRNRIRVNQLDIGWMASDGERPRAARVPRRRSGLAHEGRCGSAFWPAAGARGGGSCGRLPRQRRQWNDDRLGGAVRPIGVGRV